MVGAGALESVGLVNGGGFTRSGVGSHGFGVGGDKGFDFGKVG